MRAVIDKYSGLPFRYGQDCCQFVGECIESITGKNPVESLSYSTELEAQVILGQFNGLEGAMRHFLGEPYEGFKDGDACLIDNNNGERAAAIVYRNRVIARVMGGLMDYPRSRALLVWNTDAYRSR